MIAALTTQVSFLPLRLAKASESQRPDGGNPPWPRVAEWIPVMRPGYVGALPWPSDTWGTSLEPLARFSLKDASAFDATISDWMVSEIVAMGASS